MQVSSHSVTSKLTRPAGGTLVYSKWHHLARGLITWLASLPQTLLIGLLQAYKLLISPLLGSRCRFHPSCSSYAQISIQRFGVIRGGWLTVRRLARCGPWHPGGIDEVPCRTHTHSSESS